MLLAGVEQQCIVLRCIWWLVGLFFLPPVCSFYDTFYFQLLVFIASVKVIDDDRIPPSYQNPNLRTRHGLDAVKF